MREIRKLEPSKPQLPKRLRTAAYARVSSGKDAMLQSLSAQVSYFSDYIQRRREWEFIGVYADEALTGTKETRPEFQRLIADCRAGLIDLVVTKSVTRFARNTVTMLEIVRELKLLGVDVFFEKENIHSMSGDGELMLTILASFAQEESLSASENCKWRIKEKFEKGETVGFFSMYGYDFIKGETVINEEQAAVIRQIFDWYIGDGSPAGGMGTAKIAQRLNKRGIPALLGGRWSASRIGDLIKNEKLTGNALLQKWFSTDHLTKKQKVNRGEKPRYFAEGTHTAIIDEATFEEAQQIRQERAAHAKVSDSSKNVYPFTGKILCEHCWKRYKHKKGVGKFYWQCGTFLQEGKAFCPAKQVPEETLMAVTAEVLGLAVFDETIFKNRITEIRIPSDNRLVFIFSDGRIVKREWQDRSRRESWTESMKQQARQRALNQHHGEVTL